MIVFVCFMYFNLLFVSCISISMYSFSVFQNASAADHNKHGIEQMPHNLYIKMK